MGEEEEEDEGELEEAAETDALRDALESCAVVGRLALHTRRDSHLRRCPQLLIHHPFFLHHHLYIFITHFTSFIFIFVTLLFMFHTSTFLTHW